MFYTAFAFKQKNICEFDVIAFSCCYGKFINLIYLLNGSKLLNDMQMLH